VNRDQAQIKQNFDAGVGEKFFLLFGISHLIDVPKAYIMFEATQYDSFSYLFNTPKFISLDPAAMPGSIPLKDIRIGVNGVEAVVGQAYRTLDTTISNEQYSAATGQLLSAVGTIIPLEQGPASDEFFLCFDTIGTRQKVCSDYTPSVRLDPVPGPVTVSDIGVKTFDAINATMASITGVSPNNAKVNATYTSVRQSLPAVHDISGFLSSHQTSIAQLALQYCSVMVDDDSLRSAFFGNVNFGSTLADDAAREPFVDALYQKGVGSVVTQPGEAAFKGKLNELMSTLCTSRACGAQRTLDVLKAACGATLGSAATVVQ
jgi:hypothetical protein